MRHYAVSPQSTFTQIAQIPVNKLWVSTSDLLHYYSNAFILVTHNRYCIDQTIDLETPSSLKTTRNKITYCQCNLFVF